MCGRYVEVCVVGTWRFVCHGVPVVYVRGSECVCVCVCVVYV